MKSKFVIIVMLLILGALVYRYLNTNVSPQDQNSTQIATTIQEKKELITKIVTQQTEVDIEKAVASLNHTKSNNFITGIKSDIELSALQQSGTYINRYSKIAKDSNWFKRTFRKSIIDISFDYTVRMMIKADDIDINNTNNVLEVKYSSGDIYPIIETANTVMENSDIGVFGEEYTNTEKSALIEDTKEKLREEIEQSPELYTMAAQNIDDFIVGIGNKLDLDTLILNGTQVISPRYAFEFQGTVENNCSYTPRTEDVKYIVIHSTAVLDKDAEAFYNSYNTYDLGRNSMAHFYADYDSIQQCVATNLMAGHCYYDEPYIPCTNNNSLGIEICEFSDVEKQELAIQNCVKFVKEVLVPLFPEAKIVMHRQIKPTLCPRVLTEERFYKLFY